MYIYFFFTFSLLISLINRRYHMSPKMAEFRRLKDLEKDSRQGDVEERHIGRKQESRQVYLVSGIWE